MSPQASRPAGFAARWLRAGARVGPGGPDAFFARAARTPPRILLVKTHDQLGDFLVATPVFRALRAHFPHARLELVTRAYLAPLAHRQPAIDRVHVTKGGGAVRGGPGLIALVHALRSPRPDLALVLNSVSRSRTADLLAVLAHPRLIAGRSRVGAGPPGPDPAEPARDPVYDLDVDVAPGSAHQVDRLLDLVRWTGAQWPRVPRMTLAVTGLERAQRRSMLSVSFGRGAKGPPARVVGIHPAAANALKCWPVDAFVELGARLAARGARLVVFDTPKETGPALGVVVGLAARGVETIAIPPGELDEFIQYASAVDLMVCNDSGVMHIAAALGVATLSFHSLGEPAEWAPRGERAIALHAQPIEGIGVDDAERAAVSLI